MEDVTGYEEAKLAGILAHASQHRSTMAIEGDDTGAQLAAFRSRLLGRLAASGEQAGVAYGEAFKLIQPL